MSESPSCSIVEYFAEHEGYSCGYCKSSDTNFSHGMWASCLTVQDYQDLINRGWRRSGKYCYKPTMDVTCCPQYTIRCEALNIKLSKSQKNIIKKVNKFIVSGRKKENESIGNTEDFDCNASAEVRIQKDKAMLVETNLALKDVPNVQLMDKTDEMNCSSSLNLPATCNSCDDVFQDETKCERPSGQQDNKGSTTKLIKSGDGPDSSKPPCKKAKQLRLQRREEKLKAKRLQGINVDEKVNKMPKNQEKTIEEFLDECNVPGAVNKLQCKMVLSNPCSKQFNETLEESYAVYLKYQEIIHNDPPDKCTMSQFIRFLVDSPLEIKLVSVSSQSDDFNDTLNESYKLYKKYQMAIHNESASECDWETYLDGFVNSPLKRLCPVDGPPCGYGSFHQQYWFNGKIIAVAVLDVLPHLISSVYFYYDPDYRFLTLGTYASLKEIALTREFHQRSPELKFYYMGFYIHSCPKMRYKGQYHPSYLLCPEVYTWHPIEQCTPRLDVSKYSRFHEDQDAVDSDKGCIANVFILYKHRAMTYTTYKAMVRGASNEAEIKQYLGLVGVTCARQMLLYRAT